MVALNIDCRTIDPSGPAQDIVPPAIYKSVIVATELKPTKSKDGMFLQADERIIEGDQTGKIVISRFNIQNPNEQASRIALQQISALGHVCGVLLIGDSTMLHNIPHMIKVEAQYNDKNVQTGNNVVGWFDINGNPPGKHGAAGPGAVASAVAGPGPAWAGGQAPPPSAPQVQAQPPQAWAAPSGQPQPGPQAWGGAPTQPAPAASAPQAWVPQGQAPAGQPAAAPPAWGPPGGAAAPTGQPPAWSAPR